MGGTGGGRLGFRRPGPEPCCSGAGPAFRRPSPPRPASSTTWMQTGASVLQQQQLGGDHGPVTEGGAPQTLLNGLYLHATHASGHLLPCMSFICTATPRHFHHTNFEQLPNTLEFPSERLHHRGGEFKGHWGGSIIQSEQLFCAGSPLKVGSGGGG